MKKFAKYLPYIALVQALAAMLGSLFFSEILHIPPCVLCWYQRIFMYPLVTILTVGIFRRHHKELPFYVLPLSIGGLLVSIYQNLLYYHILPETIAPCSNGISCTSGQIAFGVITIPLLSALAFAFITASMILYWRFSNLSLRGGTTKQTPR